MGVILLLSLVAVVSLFVFLQKYLPLKKSWYSTSNIKPPSSCCSVCRRKLDDRISLF